MTGTKYSMGFLISHSGDQILLLHKNRPAFLAGQWMGVAGHIEESETPLEAMRREAKEEADVDVSEWSFLGVVAGQNNPLDQIFMFAARGDLSLARTMTDEDVRVFTWDEVATLNLGLATQQIMEMVREFSGQETLSSPKRPTP